MPNSKAGLDRKLEETFPSHTRTNEKTRAQDRSARDKPQLKMQWIIVTENGKRRLQMQWSVRADRDADSQGLQTRADECDAIESFLRDTLAKSG